MIASADGEDTQPVEDHADRDRRPSELTQDFPCSRSTDLSEAAILGPLANRSARNRAVFAWMASLSALYSFIANSASRARVCRAAIFEACSRSCFGNFHLRGLLAREKRAAKTPRAANRTRGLEPQTLPVHPWSR
jgi:hypothetical protein